MPVTLKELAQLTHSELIGDPSYRIENVADLEEATAFDASFFSNPRYQRAFEQSQAGVIFVTKQAKLKENRQYLLCENPSTAFQQLIDLFYPSRSSPSGFTGIHPTAVIHPTAHLEENVTVGPYAVIDEHVRIKKNTFIGSGTYVGPYTTIGESCLIHPHVVIRESCIVGDYVIFQPGAVIGSCGFGYQTNAQGEHIKLNQVGHVSIENHVEIGANTTIDRSRFKSTQIGKGTKIDNLVQVGHGVQVGPFNLYAAQVGIAGSSSTGNHVILGGQVGVAGHLHLDSYVIASAQTGITKSLQKGTYRGTPATTIQDFNRNFIFLRKIESYINQLKNIQDKVSQIEERFLESDNPSN